MGWVVTAVIWSGICYGIGYFVRGKVDDEEVKEVRKEMGLDGDVDCKNCKDLKLPCDDNCRKRKEMSQNGKSEKNNTEEN